KTFGSMTMPDGINSFNRMKKLIAVLFLTIAVSCFAGLNPVLQNSATTNQTPIAALATNAYNPTTNFEWADAIILKSSQFGISNYVPTGPTDPLLSTVPAQDLAISNMLAYASNVCVTLKHKVEIDFAPGVIVFTNPLGINIRFAGVKVKGAGIADAEGWGNTFIQPYTSLW